MMNHMYPIVVIGAGQAGLSAAYHLQRRGLLPGKDFVVLDANDRPGGAWADRWDSLTLGGAHHIHPLPASEVPGADESEPANRLVPRYFSEYEDAHGLQVVRPSHVDSVHTTGRSFELRTSVGIFRSYTIINATGTWNRPFIPHYPGLRSFQGKQVHTRTYRNAQDFTGLRVLVVGGGTSAVQFIQELHAGGVDTVWSTRSSPKWTATPFDEEWGAHVEARVNRRTSRGQRPLSVVATTGIPLVDRYVPDILSGLLIARGGIVQFTEDSVILTGPGPDGRHFPSQGEADLLVTTAVRDRVAQLPGTPTAADPAAWRTPIEAILWATGFRHDLNHLSPLRLRRSGGGILLDDDGVSVNGQPGLFLTGYGASASTLGATRAGRRAALKALRYVDSFESASDARHKER